MKIILAIILACAVSVLLSFILEYLYEKRVYKELKYINHYLRVLKKESILIRHKGKSFFITVDRKIADPVYVYTLYINDELVLDAYALNHGATDSRQLEYSDKRSQFEINRLQRLAFKKLKHLYYDEYLKIDFSYTSFYKD